MKALSLRQPWAWLICAGLKDIENRTWSTRIRGRVYVHAGKTADVNVPGRSLTEAWILERLSVHGLVAYDLATKHRGAIIGSVVITDCVTEHRSKWFAGPYGFVLVNPVLYEQPIPCKGRLGFFEPDIGEGRTQ